MKGIRLPSQAMSVSQLQLLRSRLDRFPFRHSRMVSSQQSVTFRDVSRGQSLQEIDMSSVHPSAFTEGQQSIVTAGQGDERLAAMHIQI